MEHEFNTKSTPTIGEILKIEDGQDKSQVLGQRLVEMIKRFDAKAVRTLILAEANVNVQDEFGMTPMHYAAALGARPCLRILISSKRCDLTIHDNEYRYSSQLAMRFSRDYAVARLLSKHEARQLHEKGLPGRLRGPQTPSRMTQPNLI